MTYLIVFLCGLLYEAGCVFWVYAAEQRSPIKIAFWSMLCATTQLTGVVETVHDIWHAPIFILGYGVGAAVAVLIKQRLSPTPKP